MSGGAAAAAAAAAAYGASRGAYSRGTKRTRHGGSALARKRLWGQSAFRPGYDRTGGFYGMALAQRRARQSRMNSELKFHDVDIDDASIAQNGTILNSGTVNIIPQGTEEDQRIGRKCVIKSINWWGNLSLGAGSAAATASDTVRIILYLDKQCNGATASVTDLLAEDNYQSFNNLANKERFRTLMDKTFALSPSGAGGNGTTNFTIESEENFSFYSKCNISIEYSSTLGALTEIRSNNLGVLVLAKDGGRVTLDSKMRLRFTE